MVAAEQNLHLSFYSLDTLSFIYDGYFMATAVAWVPEKHIYIDCHCCCNDDGICCGLEKASALFYQGNSL